SAKLEKRESKLRFANKKYQGRYRLRTGNDPTIVPYKEPGTWGVSPHFDPHYCLGHSKYLSRVIWQKLQAREYAPKPAILYQIPKETCDTRDVMVFTIPDAAVANIFNARMRDRNRNIMSPFC